PLRVAVWEVSQTFVVSALLIRNLTLALLRSAHPQQRVFLLLMLLRSTVREVSLTFVVSALLSRNQTLHTLRFFTFSCFSSYFCKSLAPSSSLC
ncbi:MAG: hypothetical protein R3Y56_06945, partial [Akkermansia sp.]